MALYKQLKLVAGSLGILASASDAPKAVHVRLAGQVAKACNMLHNTNQKLLQLSVLVPAAPLVSTIFIVELRVVLEITILPGVTYL